MNILLCLLGIILFFLGFAILYEKKDSLELLLHGIIAFLFLYILVSAVLFFINQFSITRALTGTVAGAALTDLIVFLVYRRKPKFSFDLKRNMFGILICIVFLPLSFTKYGLFGVGQDQGVYQAKAIALIEGYNDNVLNLDEYESLKDGQARLDYENEVYQKLLGFYTYDYNFPDQDSTQYQNDLSGVFHGISTFPALLALWGSIFGINHIMGIQTLFYMIGILLIGVILRNIHVKLQYQALGSFLFACSPLVLWISKTSLVELFLAVIIMYFIYFLTDNTNPQLGFMAFLPVAVFSCYHITIYVMMPMFCLILFGMFLATRRYSYVLATVLSLVSYYLGYRMMALTNAVYTYGNYNRLYHFGIGVNNLTKFITIVVIVTIVLVILLSLIPFSKMKHVGKKVWAVLVWGLLLVSIAGILYVAGKTTYPLNYLTIYAYFISSGIFVLPVIYLVLFLRPGFINRNHAGIILSFMFYYTVIIYSVVFKKEVINYYYYARYIVPYLSIILILGMYLINEAGDVLAARKSAVVEKNHIDGKNRTAVKDHITEGTVPAGSSGILKRLIKEWAVPALLGLVVFGIMIPYNRPIVLERDMTEFEWSALEQVVAQIPQGSAVFIDPQVDSILKFPVRFMTNSDVYPYVTRETMQRVAVEKNDQSIYYITKDSFENNKTPDVSVAEIKNVRMMDCSSPENMFISGRFVPFAKAFVPEEQTIQIYQYK